MLDYEHDSSPAQTVDFDWDTVYGALDKNKEVARDHEPAEAWEIGDAGRFVVAMSELFDWIAQATTDRAKAVRVQAVRRILCPDKNQVRLAREIGVTKAAISKVILELHDLYHVKAPGLRTKETREKFSQQCKLRHQKKAAASTNSPTKLIAPSGKRVSLAQRLFELSGIPATAR